MRTDKLISFSSGHGVSDPELIGQLGGRGEWLVALAELGVPILPGTVIPNALLLDREAPARNLAAAIKRALKSMGEIRGEEYGVGDGEPLLVKILVSPTLKMVDPISSIHGVGLCGETIEKFTARVGENFAYYEYRRLLSGVLNLEARLPATEKQRSKRLKQWVEKLEKAKTVKQTKDLIEGIRGDYSEEFFKDPHAQLLFVIELFRRYLEGDAILGDSPLLIQAMAFGAPGEESFYGEFYTRDIVTGAPGLTGEFHREAPGFGEKKKVESIGDLPEKCLKQLKKVGKNLEHWSKEIRWVRFTIERGQFWVVDQASAIKRSMRAELQTLLDLHKKGVVDDEYLLKSVKPQSLGAILHPVVDYTSGKKVSSVTGGIVGSRGAAVGRVFLSTGALLKEHRLAQRRGEPQDFILAMPSTYAEDVRAIEVANGVLSRDGGYASHAPVVARSLGKVAAVYPGIEFKEGEIKIDKRVIKEGDYITLDVPTSGSPTIFFGQMKLISPDFTAGGLPEFLEIAQKHIGHFDVRANADQPRDARLARLFLCAGIGLCRTEHMFFDEGRILHFRSMILANNRKERESMLTKLKKFQVDDFYRLFKEMEGKPVTIRLLDAPLHEFLPHTRESMLEFIEHCKKVFPGITSEEVRLRCDLLREENPMLGHRGVRLAVSYPEIYQMQTDAIFEAAYKLQRKEGISASPELMIPLVISANEVKALRFGKKIEGKDMKGIIDIEEGVRKKYEGENPIHYKVGAMIELPGAALRTNEFACYADFVSFGTNDLTQATYGISRDDFNSFFSDYNEFDILEDNPFRILGNQVRELMGLAVGRGRMIRPDLKVGLCGEHGAEPENIAFAFQNGLDYVSCSPYAIPAAKLAIAQINLDKLCKEKQRVS